MRINKKLNLVIPILDDGDETKTVAVVHATPIGSETFRAYHLPIAKTFTAFHANRLGSIGAPRIAHMLLEDASRELGIWESDPKTNYIGVKEGLIAEIHRLANVWAPTQSGWKDYMYSEALSAGIITADDAAEVDAALVFFTVSSHMLPRRDLKVTLTATAMLWGARVESSTFTELQASLPTSTANGSSGATAAAS